MIKKFQSEFLNILSARGFIHQGSDLAALDAAATTGPITAYVGYDCTADSLHVGSLLSIMMLRWAQKTGHRPIALMGGGTTKVGDPSGRDEGRQLLSDETIAANMAGIERIFKNYLQFGSRANDALMVNNAEWLEKLEYIAFLREVGRHFSVNRMLSFDSVKLRLEREQPLSFIEFNYMIMQAYDFLELNRRYGCTLQMGGSDQWGNIVNGVELCRRVDQREVFALTCPLLTTASGAKMGKTAAGAVWLNAERLPPFDFWQYWRNTEDADVGKFLRLFTELDLSEIERLEKLGGAEINKAKKILATQATTLCHGADAAAAAEAQAENTFINNTPPEFALSMDALREGKKLVDLIRMLQWTNSKSDARRLIKSNAVKIDDKIITDENYTLTPDNVGLDGIKLSVGKKHHVLITGNAKSQSIRDSLESAWDYQVAGGLLGPVESKKE
jgi:tyrosyl-tRNA synthetase